MNQLRNRKWIFLVLVVLLPVAIGVSLFIGTANISLGQGLRVLWGQLMPRVPTDLPAYMFTIILKVRLPRTMMALLCGAALGASGTVLQCLFRNPMADPYIMGISSGAAFGVSLAVISGLAHPLLIQFSAFGGAISSVLLVLLIAHAVRGGGNSLMILLSGIAVSLFFSSAMSLVLYLHREHVEKIMFWTFGSLSGNSWKNITLTALILLPALGILLSRWRILNLLSQGDETAGTMGIHPARSRVFLLLLTSLITAVTVSMTGIIGYVGLLIPHIFRLLTGPDHKTLVPLSSLGGAVFLMLADTLSRVLLSPTEIPVGIVTSMIGAPYLFITLFLWKRRSH